MGLTVRAQTLEFSGSFFEGGITSEDDPPSLPGSGLTTVEDEVEPQYPLGLWQYETMAVLWPDMLEDERLALTQKYEEVKYYFFLLVHVVWLIGNYPLNVFFLGIKPLKFLFIGKL
ncbi:hypothetical protein UlMin_024153 [Ulmus minor]